MFAGAGDLFPVMLALDKGVFQTEGVDPKVRQIIILRCAKVMNAPYVWKESVAMANNLGLSAEEIEATASNGSVEGIGSEYVVLCKAADELSNTATLMDETLAYLLATYGGMLARKYIAVICWFNFMCRF